MGILLFLAPLAVTRAEERPEAVQFALQERAAFALFEKREWDKAIAAFEKQIAIFAHNPSPYYNIACCYALQGKADRAATWLTMSIERGWRDLRHLERDPDFRKVRDSAEYRACLAVLAAVRRSDPDPLPEPEPIESVRAAASARTILVESAIEQRALDRRRALLAESQVRRLLFQLYNHRLGRLSRYLTENGDARDASIAAHERVRTAMLYLARADRHDASDRGLMRASALLVYLYAERFLRGWAGSPLVGDVLYWRAHALGTLGEHARAARSLRALADDLDGAQRGRALAELCAVLAKTDDRRDELLRAVTRLEEEHSRIIPTMLPRLTKALLLAKGIRDERRVAGRARTLYVFVTPEEFESEQRLATLRGLRRADLSILVVPVVRERTPEVDGWLAKHAAGLQVATEPLKYARDMWIARTPTVVLAATGRVIAVDPGESRLRRLLGE